MGMVVDMLLQLHALMIMQWICGVGILFSVHSFGVYLLSFSISHPYSYVRLANKCYSTAISIRESDKVIALLWFRNYVSMRMQVKKILHTSQCF